MTAEIKAVKAFGIFTHDNDPLDEHDFGAFGVEGHRLFWKFGYYDLSLEGGSPDPTESDATCRVLTVLLPSD